MGLFDKLKSSLSKTRDSISKQIDGVFKAFVRVDDELLDQLEELLIMGDVGFETSQAIIETLRERIRDKRLTAPEQVRDELVEVMCEIAGEHEPLRLDTSPSVILIVGVNGVGKTTSIGKLAAMLRRDGGKSVILAAADTFRAAAAEQLEIWAQRAGVELIRGAEGADPSSIVYDAIGAAKSRHADVLIIDTAGRLHTKKNLMDELAKINRVVDRELPGCRRETLLVLDSTTGQNAISQAREFAKSAAITGLIMTKLDGTAKGGVAISVMRELQVPIKFVMTGEQLDDIQPFEPREYVRAIFEG